ncbi:hypothetical protein C8J57DRAFT_1331815 [Mycena rebaudengoi]|nr:hypothetical protein C8J57DRAFT_1331815 [Mycena rebaudengoi]
MSQLPFERIAPEVVPLSITSLALFHSFPTETLCEIFLWSVPTLTECLSTKGPSNLGGSFYVRRSPWVLAHICSHWRAVALSLPDLWTLLVFTNQAIAPYDMLETQLLRSGARPLYISIKRRPTLSTYRLLEILMTASQRWRELSFTVLPTQAPVVPIFPLLATARRRLSTLRRLYLDIPGWSPPCSAFGVAPELQDVHLGDSFVNLPLLPSTQLTRLCLAGDFSKVLPIIRLAAPSLEFLRVQNSNFLPEDVPMQQLYLPHLRELQSDAEYLQCISAPQAQTFIATRSGCIEHLLPFIQRSSCSLRKLLFVADDSPIDISSVLAQTPELTELHIDVHDRWPVREWEQVNLLLPRLRSTSTPLIVPHLRVFGIASSEGINQDAVVDMIHSRWHIEPSAHCRQLNRVSLTTGAAWKKDVLARLYPVSIEGLEVDLFFHVPDDEMSFWSIPVHAVPLARVLRHGP